MKSLLAVVFLATAYVALPALAQQGPAGVPGATWLFSPTPPPPSPPQIEPSTQKPTACMKARNVERCMAREEAKRKVSEACKGKRGAQYQQCVKQKKAQIECSKGSDPARCEQYRKTRDICQSKLGQEYMQCLHDNLLTKK